MILGSEESLSRKPLLQNHIDLSSGSMSQILFQAYYWDCQLQKCWLEFMLLENHWQEDKFQSYGEIESMHVFEVDGGFYWR